MELIIESGATKSDWIVISRHKKREIKQFTTEGLNVSAMPMNSIAKIIEDAGEKLLLTEPDLYNDPYQEAQGPNNGLHTGVNNKLHTGPIEKIYLYLAGVASEENKEQLNKLLLYHISPSAKVEIETDLMAAARGICGRNPGIIGILGTGSNACFYDGRQVVDKINPGGYILGDEGSAACLGKLFISDYIKGLIPEEVARDFQNKQISEKNHISDYARIIEQVYKSETPSKYLGSLAPFILKHYNNPYIKEIVDNNIRSFFRRLLIPLLERNIPKQCSIGGEKLPIGIMGGFGLTCKEIIKRIAEEFNVEITSFYSSPIEGLIRYHL